jgi:hypothetical protein
LAAVIGAGLFSSFEARAAVPESRPVPLASSQTTQPWGGGELGGTNSKDTATFEMNEPWSGAYHMIAGEVLLPAVGSTFTVPEVKVTVRLDPAKKHNLDLTVGGKAGIRSATVLSNDVKVTWIPFSIRRLGLAVTVQAGALAGEKQAAPLAPADSPLTLTLQNGARVRNVSVTTLPRAMAILPLDACAPATAEKDRSPTNCPAFDPASLPKGLLTVDGVPFMVGERPVDVQFAQKGVDFSRRLKFFTTTPPSAQRPVGTAAGKSYAWLHVLAYSRQMADAVPRMTLSYGDCVSWAGVMDEEVINVPDFSRGGDSPYLVSRVPVKLAEGSAGWLYHLRLPVARSANYWFRNNTSFEFSREKQDLHNQPDPNEFARVPVGLPSSVVVVSATAERAPVEFTYVLTEPGNVFYETSSITLKVSLANRLASRFEGRLYARSAGPGTAEESNVQRSEWTVEQPVTLDKGEAKEIAITVMPAERKKRGWFDLEIGVESGGLPVQVYRNTYAVLAPDTRKAQADSPFGIWEFWGVHTMYGQGKRHSWDIASLIRKGGWRWTYGGDARGRGQAEGPTAEQLFDQFNITYTIRNLPNSYQRASGWWNEKEFEEKVAPIVRENAKTRPKGIDRVYKVLHESRSSDTMLRRYSELLGGVPYEFPAAEKQKVDDQFANVVKYCQAIKKVDPEAKICLINDYPGVGVEYMKRGMPKDAFDYFGSEMANFMREPERQPDWLCLLGLTHQWQLAKEKYGYTDKPVWTTEALYHATNPGNLGLHAQAVIQSREAMLALANGVERMCAAGCIRDVTDDYRWSNWGMCGLCFREPEINPKPGYAMYAWLTQILDQAKYAGRVAQESTSLHILDFARPDGSHVYPVWCVRGRQEVTVAVKGGTPIVYDAYGNTLSAPVVDGKMSLSVCDTPLFVTGAAVEGVVARTPVEGKGEAGEVLLDFDGAAPFKAVAGPSKILEASWDYPRIKGDYAVEMVKEDGAGTVKVELKDDADPRKLLQRYVELELTRPLVLKDLVESFTVRVKGNGGWGRVMFELVDAEGRLWTSCGNQYAGSCNSSDNKGESYISFDGWRTLAIPAPGRYPARDVVAFFSSTCTWWPENTPELRQQLVERQKTEVDYATAMKEFPAQKKAYEEAKQAYDAKQAETLKAKAAYAKEHVEYVAAMKSFAKNRVDYLKAKTEYDRALKQGKPAGVEPVAPQELKAPSPPAPVELGEAPKALKEPKAPGVFRNFGIAAVTYPVTLTKIIVAASPSMLYVADEVPLKNRAIFIDRIGVRLTPKE